MVGDRKSPMRKGNPHRALLNSILFSTLVDQLYAVNGLHAGCGKQRYVCAHPYFVKGMEHLDVAVFEYRS
jgi:hypothetical protein